MKNAATLLSLKLLVVAFLAATENPGVAQVTLTVSPPVVSNTYPGVITLNITGLTNGEKVVVQKRIDLNSNGAIDPGEPLMDSFKLVDNNNSYAIIGGVTNINRPFDTNPTNGVITASLSLPSGMVLENMSGSYVFQVVSPTGRFAPVTATFAVTNTPLPQSISGTVYGSDGITPFPNALVVAQDQVNNDPGAAVVADSNGHYVLPLYPGKYGMIAGTPNYYFDFSTGVTITLTNGMNATNNNLILKSGTNTITGTALDAGNSNSLPGVMLQVQSGNYFEIVFTDANGNYSAAVPSGFWKIQPVKERLSRRAYVLPQAPFQVDATSGNVSNANIPLPQGNALFYGRVTDNFGNPFVNIKVDGSTSGQSVNTSYGSKGYTDVNGYYAAAVIGDLTNQWSSGVDSGDYASNIRNYIMNTFNSSTFSPGQTVQENFVGLPATATISGRVLNNAGSPVTGVGLYANATIGGNNYSSLEGITDSSGNYSLIVASGVWNVYFLTGGFSDNLDTKGYEDVSGPHYVTIPPTNVVLNFTVYPLGTPVISSPQFVSPGHFGFWVNGSNNVSYAVQVSGNLASTNWSSIYSFQITSNSLFITDSTATNSPRFYRIFKSH